jgi:hypothetical protein
LCVFTRCKNDFEVWIKIIRNAKFSIYFAQFVLICC